eukprot:jgi/Chlat1/5564/Chrsp369S05354
MEDEEELELASISSSEEAGNLAASLLDSDDDDSTTQPSIQPRRYSRDSDFGEDGLSSWQDVDHQEMAMQVAGILHSYITRADDNSEEATMLRELSLHEANAEPTEHEDPLGLGLIDPKSKSLIKEDMNDYRAEQEQARRRRMTMSLRASQVLRKAPEQQAKKLHPMLSLTPDDDNILPSSEHFDAEKYLARVHRETSMRDLAMGHRSLKERVSERQSQLKALVKDNFERFVSCGNTIEDIAMRLHQNVTESDGTTALSNAVGVLLASSQRAFVPLIERQEQADRIRSVLGLLSRFQSLFNLPSTMKEDIHVGKYEKVVREYKKAKSLIESTQQGILHKLWEEISQVVKGFQGMLYRALDTPGLRPEDAERDIRLLYEIDASNDAVWHYLQAQHHHILGLFEDCEHQRAEGIQAVRQRAASLVHTEARWKELNRPAESGVNISLLLGSTSEINKIMETSSTDLAQVHLEYIAQLTAVLTGSLPEYWRLVQSVVNGKFLKQLTVELSAADDKRTAGDSPIPNTPRVAHTNKLLQGHTPQETEQMVFDLMAVYQAKVHNGVSEVEAAGTKQWRHMREATQEVAEAQNHLQSVAAIPTRVTAITATLVTETCGAFVQHVCRDIRELSTNMFKLEDWTTAPIVMHKRIANPFRISKLPLHLGSLLSSAMEDVSSVLHRSSASGGKRPVSAGDYAAMLSAVRSTFHDCFAAFADGLRLLAKESITEKRSGGQDMDSSPASTSRTAPSTSANLTVVTGAAGDIVVSREGRLLMLISNCAHSRTILLPELAAKFNHVFQTSSKLLQKLEEELLSLYIDRKVGVLHSAAEAFLNDGSVWAAARPPLGVRGAVQDLLLPLVQVHSEVYVGAELYVERIISHLLVVLLNELMTAITHRLKSLSANGYCQLSLEVDYLEVVLATYAVQGVADLYTSLRALLLQLATSTAEPATSHRSTMNNGGPPVSAKLEAAARATSAELLEHELRRTRINVLCFAHDMRAQRQNQPTRSSSDSLPSAASNGTAASSAFATGPGRPESSRMESVDSDLRLRSTHSAVETSNVVRSRSQTEAASASSGRVVSAASSSVVETGRRRMPPGDLNPATQMSSRTNALDVRNIDASALRQDQIDRTRRQLFKQ